MLENEDYFDGAELIEDLNFNWSVNILESYGEDSQTIPGKMDAVVSIWEELRFHANLNPELFNEDGSLMDAARDALMVVLQSRYGAESVEFDSSGENEEFVTFEVVLSGIDEYTSAEELSDRLWNDTPLVNIHNEVDPGTFGSPYLFGSLLTNQMDKG